MIKFCKKCNCETERYADGKCKPCKDKYDAAYRAANAGKLKEYQATYRAENSDKRRAYGEQYSKKYYAANRDKQLEASRKYLSANPDKKRKYQAKYYAANRDKVLDRQSKYSAANLEKRRLIWHNRKARKIAAGGNLSPGLATRLFKLQKGKCACCGKPLGDNYHLDHILPLALGGTNTDDNIQLLRAKCNLQKSAKHPVDFMQERGLLL